MWNSLFQTTVNSISHFIHIFLEFTLFLNLFTNLRFYLFIHHHELVFYGHSGKPESGFECIKQQSNECCFKWLEQISDFIYFSQKISGGVIKMMKHWIRNCLFRGILCLSVFSIGNDSMQ